jgi:hypothetical protein
MEVENDSALKSDIRRAVELGEHVQSEVQRLTLKALSGGGFDMDALRSVAREARDGVDLGVVAHGQRAKAVLEQAYAGLDGAFAGAAEAAALAVKQALGNAHDFVRNDVERMMNDLKAMEALYLEILSEKRDRAGTVATATFRQFAEHARRSGSAVGEQVRRSLDELVPLAHIAGDQLQEGRRVTKQAGGLLARAASGFLAAIADRVEEKGASAGDQGRK